MLGAVIRVLWRIKRRDRVPPLPRMLATRQKRPVGRSEGRVLARLGARDARGVKVAMKRAGVDNVQQLSELLAHFRPQRHVLARIDRLIGRFFGALDYMPHRLDIIRAGRRRRADSDTRTRIQNVIETFKQS